MAEMHGFAAHRGRSPVLGIDIKFIFRSVCGYNWPDRIWFSGNSMYEINRSLAIIKPKQQFLDWLTGVLDPVPEGMTLDELRRDATAILIPEFDDEESALQFVYSNYDELFERELEDWVGDERTWPSGRTLKLFKEWFDIEIHSMVTDMVEDDFANMHASSLSLH